LNNYLIEIRVVLIYDFLNLSVNEVPLIGRAVFMAAFSFYLDDKDYSWPPTEISPREAKGLFYFLTSTRLCGQP
jgi:hypothetical protein